MIINKLQMPFSEKHGFFNSLLMVLSLQISAMAQPRKPENVPITFYGKAIDQHGEPVAWAKVNFVIGIIHAGEDDTAEKPITLTTDSKGCFALTDANGYAIDKLSIVKNGYEFSQKNRRGAIFGFRPDYTPDSTNPMVFQMWKQAGKEPLVSSAWHGKVACDGTTNRFDLVSGHPRKDGNLEITCKRNPLNSPPPGNARFDYAFEIRIIAGTIQPTRDEFTFLAPDSGYSTSVIFTQNADDIKWDGLIPKDFYIKTADGHYGRLFVDWNAWQGSPSYLEWNCSINPSGSRNLER